MMVFSLLLSLWLIFPDYLTFPGKSFKTIAFLLASNIQMNSRTVPTEPRGEERND
jgi:hypothetical protein